MITKLSKFWLKRDFKKKKKAKLHFTKAVDSVIGKCVDELIPTYQELMKKFNPIKDEIFRRIKKLGVLQGDFTQKEIEDLKSKNIMHRFILVLFISAETGLYFLTSQLFIQTDSFVMKIILSLFLALLVLVLLEWAFSQHFEYRFVIENYEKGLISNADKKNANDRRFGGYLIAALGFGIIIASGLVRIYYLEQIDLTGYTKEEIATMEIVGRWTSILTMCITLALGIFLAFLKGEQVENHLRLKEYKKWRYTTKKLNDAIKKIIDVKEIIDSLFTFIIEKYWQMLIELQVIYGEEGSNIIEKGEDNFSDNIDFFSAECIRRAKLEKILNETNEVMKEINDNKNNTLLKEG
ncbi:MAG: hypothetical protein COW71_06445 [Ignavibacteriales bacterium CG18_big_fil_WC_8_21_14_2_50_31_20]|nr:MAG: hypothetical protein COW71_06445 [Ignavibacteriales bacterium CG18_big_fil_WC_8_21_14_2_50_31_20]